MYIKFSIAIGCLILSSCAGLSNLGKVKVSSTQNTFKLRLAKKHNHAYLSADKDNASMRIKAFVSHNQKKPVKIHYFNFDNNRPAKGLYAARIRKDLVVYPEEKKLFFEGPLYMLSLNLRKENPQNIDMTIEVNFDHYQTVPIKAKLYAPWGQ